MLKPIKFKKITKKYIMNEISKFSMDNRSNEYLFNKTMEVLRKKRVFLKDLKGITFFAGKNHMEIGYYANGQYFCKHLDLIRK